MAQANAANLSGGGVTFIVPQGLYIGPAGLAMLAQFLLQLHRQNVPIYVDGDASGLRYLTRMNLMALIDHGLEDDFKRHPDAGRLLALTTVQKTGDAAALPDALEKMPEIAW